MPKFSNGRLPKYRRHKASGQAVVTLSGRDYYLGPHGSKKSRQEYDRLVGEWLASDQRAPRRKGDAPADFTIAELCLAYWKFAQRWQ
jgi:hypothetical protein